MNDQSLLEKPDRDISIEAFVGKNHVYYADVFDKIQRN